VTNTLAYDGKKLIMATKYFKVKAKCYKDFFPYFTRVRNKLECFVPNKPLQPSQMFVGKAFQVLQSKVGS
jgi:hypothetical protein